MLLTSKKIFYAVEAVLYIAYNAKLHPVAGNHVVAAQHLPPRYLEPMLQKLVRAGILRSVRGPQGGYVLARERRRISLADICAALGEDTLAPCSTALGKKILTPVAAEHIAAWRAQLADVTIATLCDRATAANIATTNPASNDFTI